MYLAHITTNEAMLSVTLVMTGVAIGILLASRIREWLKQH